MNVFLHFVSIPTELSNLYLKFSLFIKETDTHYQLVDHFNHKDTSTGWPDGKLMTVDFQKYESITLSVEITIIEVVDANGQALDANECCNNVREYESLKHICNLNSNRFVWNVDQDAQLMNRIKNAEKGEAMKSKIFSFDDFKEFEWYFSVYPKGKEEDESEEFKLLINLKQFPPGVQAMSFYFEFLIAETNTIYANFAHFIGSYLSKGWRGLHVKYEDVKKLQHLTTQIKMSVMDIFDYDGKSIL